MRVMACLLDKRLVWNSRRVQNPKKRRERALRELAWGNALHLARIIQMLKFVPDNIEQNKKN
jgi:hypothetical protein